MNTDQLIAHLRTLGFKVSDMGGIRYTNARNEFKVAWLYVTTSGKFMVKEVIHNTTYRNTYKTSEALVKALGKFNVERSL